MTSSGVCSLLFPNLSASFFFRLIGENGCECKCLRRARFLIANSTLPFSCFIDVCFCFLSCDFSSRRTLLILRAFITFRHQCPSPIFRALFNHLLVHPHTPGASLIPTPSYPSSQSRRPCIRPPSSTSIPRVTHRPFPSCSATWQLISSLNSSTSSSSTLIFPRPHPAIDATELRIRSVLDPGPFRTQDSKTPWTCDRQRTNLDPVEAFSMANSHLKELIDMMQPLPSPSHPRSSPMSKRWATEIEPVYLAFIQGFQVRTDWEAADHARACLVQGLQECLEMSRQLAEAEEVKEEGSRERGEDERRGVGHGKGREEVWWDDEV